MVKKVSDFASRTWFITSRHTHADAEIFPIPYQAQFKNEVPTRIMGLTSICSIRNSYSVPFKNNLINKCSKRIGFSVLAMEIKKFIAILTTNEIVWWPAKSTNDQSESNIYRRALNTTVSFSTSSRHNIPFIYTFVQGDGSFDEKRIWKKIDTPQ